MKLLSIDGGGVKAARAAKYVQEYTSLLSAFDCFAGCSAGSILATSYAFGFSAEYVYKSFLEFIPQIFAQNTYERIQDYNIFEPKYNSDKLKKAIDYIFKDVKLKDIKKGLIIPVFDLVNQKPKVYSNLGNKAENDIRVADIVIASCSAPTYFSSHNNCVDGGVFAVNPSLIAWNDILYHGYTVDYVLSLSSVISLKKKELRLSNAGIAQYAPVIIDLLLDSNVDITHYCMSNILRANYKRVCFAVDEQIAMDEYKKIDCILKAKETTLFGG